MREIARGTAAARAHRGAALTSNWQDWIVERPPARALPGNVVPPVPARPSHEAIACLAYAIWQQRGCPWGSPDEDWLRAELELIEQQNRK